MLKTMSRIEKSHKARPSPLDRRSGIPLYQQIQQRLLDQIRSGELVPGEPLPSIDRIAARMGVSLMTVRQAVRELCELGVIYSRQGKGTFIAATKLERDFRQVLSFTEETTARGGHPSSAVLFLGEQEPNQQTREALNLGEGEKVICLRRVRLSDGIPMGIEHSCLPVHFCPDLLESFDPTGSLYTQLAEHHGIQLVVTDEIIEVGKATAEESRLLQIPAQSAVFLFTRISYLENGTPAEYVKSVYPGDRYKVVNRLTRMKRDLTGGQGSPLLKTTPVGR
jgi:GntR family transcriptional regulator